MELLVGSSQGVNLMPVAFLGGIALLYKVLKEEK